MNDFKIQLMALRGIVASAPKEEQDKFWEAYNALNVTFQFHDKYLATIALGMLTLEKIDG